MIKPHEVTASVIDNYRDRRKKTFRQVAKEINYKYTNFNQNLYNLRKYNGAYKFRTKFAEYLNLQNIKLEELL